MNRNSSQNGSAFFIILIAIMMFAMLSYAVFQGSRGAGSSLSADQARIAAQEIIAYGDTMAKTFQTLKLRGCADNQYDLSDTFTIWKSHSGGPRLPTNPSAVAGCGPFDSTEGKMQAIVFPRNYFADWPGITGANTEYGSSYPGRVRVPGIGVETAEDLVWYLPYVKSEVCMKINEILGIKNLASGPPTHATSTGVMTYNGTFGTTYEMTDTDSAFTGKSAFCTIQTPLQPYNARFYRVLLTR